MPNANTVQSSFGVSLEMWKFFVFSFVIASSTAQIFTSAIEEVTQSATYGFEVDHENNQFLLDGKPFRYVSGSFHYFRTHPSYWQDRLRKMRAAGLNAVSTYVEWSSLQPSENEWNRSNLNDIINFIELAQNEGLYVILRPGPYICAERNLGGLPPWLMHAVPDIKMRTNDTRYMNYVSKYLEKLMSRVQPLLRGNGGPIIMVQVENEYGSFRACDKGYMETLYKMMKSYVGRNALLYTTDGSSESMLKCGHVPGAYPTIDFGTSGNVSNYFAIMRKFQPTGPLVNSEFYPGWLTHWGEPLATVPTYRVTRTLDEMLKMGASVNIYMFCGGTNFGFTSGANGPTGYSPQITSYDYDAPITEAGDLTEKYYAIQEVISKYLPLPNVTVPGFKRKGYYGSVFMEQCERLFEYETKRKVSTLFEVIYNYAPSFEDLEIAHNLVLYETDLPRFSTEDPGVLYAYTMDRGLIYVDDHFAGMTSRMHDIYTIPLQTNFGKRLQILVENQGHLNYGNVTEDWKGLLHATLNNVELTKNTTWSVTTFELKGDRFYNLFNGMHCRLNETGLLMHGPAILRGVFHIENDPMDTYLDTRGWGKGIAFINRNNLGRYWPLVGPQLTLYVPAAYLMKGTNEIILVELEYVPDDRIIRFDDIPHFNQSE